ncbi:MAG: MBL fold metallo-hydrolase [Longimicrobiaceae bacterium]
MGGTGEIREDDLTRRDLLARLGALAGVLALAGRVQGSQPSLNLAGSSSARARDESLPPHHDPSGGFVNPWPTAERDSGGFWRWQRERRGKTLPPNPPAGALPRAQSGHLTPHAPADELRVTWVGHATFLIQVGSLNLLTDPVWSRRASPVQWAGPARFNAPGIRFEDLPPIDAVLLSHDHYDHLDEPTVRRLQGRFGDRLKWFVPLAFRDWFAARGVKHVTELDWWEEAVLAGPEGGLRIIALPAQHWTSRTPWDRQKKLWCSWAVVAPGGPRVYFGGDSGWFPDYPLLGARVGPFDLTLLPIGAYEPRWFMRPVHMNPEEAVRAYRELGGEGVFAAMHWGTFRLTDEDPLEPPERTRAAWGAAELPRERLWIPAHGETRVVLPREIRSSE